jgi:hypothetical protein
METLTRLVTESMARHGFDRPVDYRRLQWSHWFLCKSHHSLLIVPSKPGVFAVAEEITRVETAANPALSESKGSRVAPEAESRGSEPRRMLAVTKFFEDDDMAFVLDRMLSHENPMRARLASGRYFVRFVVIEDPAQRRSVCSALNQWILSSSEKATGIGPHFATSLELTSEPLHSARIHHSDGFAVTNPKQPDEARATAAPRLNSAVATTIHCSSSFPSGF